MFRKSLDSLQYRSRALVTAIAVADQNNSQKERMESNRDKIVSNMNILETKLDTIKEMVREITITLKDSEESRKAFIEKEIEHSLEVVFDEGYKININLTPYKDSFRAELQLYTCEGGKLRYYNVETQNGGLCRQVISIAAGFAIAKLMNCHTIYWDEAANGGDSVKLRKLQTVLKSFVDYHPDNVIILNEHNTALYQDLDVRIFNFHKEGKGMSGYVVPDATIDQIGEILTDIILE